MASKGKKKKVRKNDEGRGIRAVNKPEYTTGTGQQMWRIHPETNAPGNGIGPVCKYCYLLIDSDPQDHSLDCNRFGNSDGLG